MSRHDMKPDDSDSRSLRAVLCLMSLLRSVPRPHPHMVVELCDIDNAHLVQLVAPVQREAQAGRAEKQRKAKSKAKTRQSRAE
jgi:hypothetical protein